MRNQYGEMSTSKMPIIFDVIQPIVVEALPILINQFEEKGWLCGFQFQRLECSILFIQYADDTIMFFCWSDGFDFRIQ